MKTYLAVMVPEPEGGYTAYVPDLDRMLQGDSIAGSIEHSEDGSKKIAQDFHGTRSYSGSVLTP